ncbi:MAG TPA: cysteine hydrolase [Hyphomicrobiales bacterium]|nr:cysteine hydrolase [Hyphomicrobiales bacterium]
MEIGDPARLALLMVDLQNDFLHPGGAYGRAGQAAPAIAALPGRIRPVAEAVRATGGVVVATEFTLVPGKSGAPLISPHLKRLRPFLAAGDFAPGSWGQAVVDELQPVDFAVEKVAYSAFYMSRLEWVLRKAGIERLAVCGITTNGGVAATVRDAHVRDIPVILLEDGCATFDAEVHRATIKALGSAVEVTTCAEFAKALG